MQKGKRVKAYLLAGMAAAFVNCQKLEMSYAQNQEYEISEEFLGMCRNPEAETKDKITGGTAEKADNEMRLPLKEEKDVFLTAAPDIELIDAGPGAADSFLVKPDYYIWSWQDGNELGTVNVCGRPPLEAAADQEDILKLRDDSQQEEADYIFHCEIMPETLIVREWEVSQSGKANPTEPSERIYKGSEKIWLKHDKIYEIVAKWSRKDGEGKGFCGEGSYVIVTD